MPKRGKGEYLLILKYLVHLITFRGSYDVEIIIHIFNICLFMRELCLLVVEVCLFRM